MPCSSFVLTLLPVLFACSGKDDGDSGSTPDDTGDTGETGETGETDETGPRQGTSGYLGEAVAGPESYAGTEEWYFLAEDGSDLCRIRCSLAAVAVRTDCDGCEWAFDLLTSASEVTAEADPGCAVLSGYDASSVADLDGRTLSYGYDGDYFGHGQALMVVIDDVWKAAAFASWDAKTGTFTYDREDSVFDY